jgi:transcriptional regulator with XRE-family HTH domain
MNTTGKGFGKRLRKLRKAAGLTQAALGASIGVSGVSIHQYEAGVHEPREKTAAKLMAFFDGAKATPADPPVPKKRGRPRKAQPEQKSPRLFIRSGASSIMFPETTIAVPCAEKAETKEHQDRLGAARSPVHRGLVSGAWIDQQVESFVKTRGHIFQDGPVRVVVMSRPDVLALCKLMLEVGAVRVE